MSDIVAAVHAQLRAAADPARAAGQQAYMKSEMPFLGAAVPESRRIARQAAKGEVDAATLLAAATTLWDEASHREERYAAMALLRVRGLRADPDVIPLVEHMVRTGRWWDYADELAHRLAEALDVRPVPTADLLRGWATDADMWMRRIAIIAQLGRGIRVDRRLLTYVIEANASDPEFFIRKSIGWALREYARVEPDWVRSFVAACELSPLSRREALKHLA
ncbi:DNA alkylation repair protein [Microbacterium sp. Root61]|uniref:DNA alkylation repair protein n=1 Tax=Microbacterium sp. Root61 TaxID=1736570 RepID=UPI0009E7C08B|nr:DNA alkylation repair protein [Microbacterium sp. Root61]